MNEYRYNNLNKKYSERDKHCEIRCNKCETHCNVCKEYWCVGKQGLKVDQGETGPKGDQGPPGESCYCKDLVYDALQTIKLLDPYVNIVAHGSHYSVSGTLDEVSNDVIVIGGIYVSICNVIYISFDRPIVCTPLNSIDVCCCNSGLATSLNEITTPFNIYMANIVDVLTVEEVY